MAFISHKVSVMSLLSLFAMSLLVHCTTADNKTNQPSYKMQPPSFCYGGIPGMHGKPGSPGVPGRDGRDGREGAKGDQGSAGKTGPQGPPGPQGTHGINGKDGAKGDQGSAGKTGPQGPPGPQGTPGISGKNGAKGGPGVQGPPGQKGQRGESGTSGIPGTPGTMPYKNWKECVWNNGDGKDNGLIKDCVFTKNFSDTSLHVYFTGNLRIYNCDSCCKRWYFTFNGAECAAPLPIDGIVYMWKGKGSRNLHHVRHIEGHCNNIRKGKVRVGFWIGNCARYGNADGDTGWNSVSRIFVEEVPKPQA